MRIRLANAAEVAHVWAARSQNEGRCANMFFDGPSIYSYGRHFEIARFDDKRNCVLMTTRRYSNTTAKHIRLVDGAVTHKDVVYVFRPDDLGESLIHALREIDDMRAAVVKAKSTAADKKRALELFIDATAAWVKRFRPELKYHGAQVKMLGHWKRRRDADKLFPAAEVERMRAAHKAENEEARRRRAEMEDARMLRDAEQEDKARDVVKAWAAGGDEQPYYSWKAGIPTVLRVKDGRVETSRGAQITVKRAAGLWALLTGGRDVAGLKLDNYTVTSWDGAVLTVGCHGIPRAELERIAAVLGLPGALPAPRPAVPTLGPCSCRPGQDRDNCPACEGTGQRIDFAALRARRGA